LLYLALKLDMGESMERRFYDGGSTFLIIFMTHTKSKSAAGLRALTILVCGMATIIFSSGSSTGDLSPGQIFRKVQENYTSLPSYSDEGQTIETMDGISTATSFTTRLARPNFYRIEWSQNRESIPENTSDQAAWSSGVGNYIQMGWGVKRQYDRDMALANAANVSSGGGVTIPRMFFDLQWSSEPDDSITGEERLADEKIGGTDCYVLTREPQTGKTITYWIGKQDFLIHQVRTDISDEAMQAAWTQATKGTPETMASFHSFSSIETHTNIVLDSQFSRQDFVPSFPLYQQPN
jgi:hypothetical protein